MESTLGCILPYCWVFVWQCPGNYRNYFWFPASLSPNDARKAFKMLSTCN